MIAVRLAPLRAPLFALALICLLAATNTWAAAAPPVRVDKETVRLGDDPRSLAVSLKAPTFLVGQTTVGGASPRSVQGDLAGGAVMKVEYAPLALGESSRLDVRLCLQWSAEEQLLRKWAEYRLEATTASLPVMEITLETMDLPTRKLWTHGGRMRDETRCVINSNNVYLQSYPIFTDGFFMGIEFPAAVSRVEGAKAILAHRPGRQMKTGQWHSSRKAVYGLATAGAEQLSFDRYIARHRPKTPPIHVNYNSWWTSSVPITEQEILDAMAAFDKELYQKHGVAVDSFCVDLGWSDPKSIWEIDGKGFPEDFRRIKAAADKMKTNLGLWFSPSSCYPPVLDNNWAKSAGYEQWTKEWTPNLKPLCPAGPRYGKQMREQICKLIKEYEIKQLKTDALILHCPDKAHGHEAAPYSSEAVVEGLIALYDQSRAMDPELWIEPFGLTFNPSPWWLFHVQLVLGAQGDDAPFGFVPSPVYRECNTSVRDFWNLQGAALLPVPIPYQEVLGIVHQSKDPFLNDGVNALMRGNIFFPLYVNPKFMDERRWKQLADLITWGRKNAEILGVTQPLLPAAWQNGKIPQFVETPMPREPYGYAHCQGQRGVIELRNPFITPATYALKLDETLGLDPTAQGLSVVSLYPEPRRYFDNVAFGQTLQVPVRPYETLVLALEAGQPQPKLKSEEFAAATAKVKSSHLERVAFKDSKEIMGPDWTSTVGAAKSRLSWKMEAEVTVEAPQAEFLLLLDGYKSTVKPLFTLTIDGQPAQFEIKNSAIHGWGSTVIPMSEFWCFLQAPLKAGKHAIAFEVMASDECQAVSAWVWSTKPGDPNQTFANALPQPETISLDALELQKAVPVSQIQETKEKIDRPVERIKGVYLDTLEPASVTQGWGKLEKNLSVAGKPIMMGEDVYPRGLGSHAPGRIVYDLDGKYSRFQAWIGGDANNFPSKMSIEVHVDGRKVWESGNISRPKKPAKWADVDVRGAKKLELVMHDGGDGYNGDNADFANARLLY